MTSEGMGTDLRKKATALIIAFLSAVPVTEAAEPDNSRPVTGVYGIEIGRENSFSSYLSPLPYSGTFGALYGNWQKALPSHPESSVMEFSGRIGAAKTHNAPVTTTMFDVDLYFTWGMAWRRRLPFALQVTAGGDIAIDGGLLWLTSNGNNPVAARFFPSVAAKGSLSWHTRIGRLPVLVTDAVRIPLAGAFFSPEYGETYYEIYLGNRSGLVHPAWPGNHFTLSNLLTVNLDFGRTAMQIGYRFEADTSWANGISTRLFRHSFVIGVIPGGLGLRHRSPVNSALY